MSAIQRWEIRVRTAALCACLGLVAVGAASAAGTDPGTTIELSLSQGRFTAPLPIDVQFFVEAGVDPEVEKVTGRLLELQSPASCLALAPAPLRSGAGGAGGGTEPPEGEGGGESEVPTILPTAAAPPEGGEGGRAEPAAGVRQSRDLGRGALVGEPAMRKVRFSVDPLAPKRNYCFLFTIKRGLTPAELEAFRMKAVQVVDGTLRQLYGSEESLSPEQAYEDFRQKLVATVEAVLGPGEELDPQERSYFDGKAPLEEVRTRYQEEFNAILGQQLNKERVVEGLPALEAAAAARLKDLKNSPVYAALVGNLSQTSTQSPLAASLIEGKDAALELVKLSDSDAESLSLGLAPGEDPGLRLSAAWDPTALGSRIQGLKGTRSTLAQLEGLVNSIERVPEFKQASGLTDDQVQQLSGLVGAAKGAFEVTASELDALRELLDGRATMIQDLVQQLSAHLDEEVPILGTTVADYQTRATWYISADVGLGWAPDIDEVFSYIGTNIYFRPVNKKAPLTGWGRGQFLKRFSVMVGLPYDNLDKEGQRMALIQERPLILGAGVRLNDHFRFAVGALVFKEEDPDPLVSSSDLAASPFLSFSVDWDVRSLFSRLGGAFASDGGGQNQ